ncbi:GNAT family N-acetyltransferase [Sphingosinicella sp. YJ22]|uniref:GNAT family N-acetyltransferase n=1 Tax=Sphingosinicella sp. YJ22 TaxID=1104780 RepID=UPI00140761C7|nr:GNAT family N-acetyltransferase [Sphingosinicella sp. YJ22]
MSHSLDRPAWNALHSRQAYLATGGGRAVGYQRPYAMFIAGADQSDASLAAMAELVPADGQAALVERDRWPLPPGTRVVADAVIVQLVAENGIYGSDAGVEFLEMGEADEPDALALATLCRPGPFFARTSAMGGFIGVRDEAGRLVAMAGERMKVGEFTEVSAVCTHPDHRGRGLAKRLIGIVAGRIVERGEIPWLHSYPDNAAALALYESLGFRRRAEVHYTIIERG